MADDEYDPELGIAVTVETLARLDELLAPDDPAHRWIEAVRLQAEVHHRAEGFYIEHGGMSLVQLLTQHGLPWRVETTEGYFATPRLP